MWKGALPLMLTHVIDFVSFDDLKTKIKSNIKGTEIKAEDIEKEMAEMIEQSRRRG